MAATSLPNMCHPKGFDPFVDSDSALAFMVSGGLQQRGKKDLKGEFSPSNSLELAPQCKQAPITPAAAPQAVANIPLPFPLDFSIAPSQTEPSRPSETRFSSLKAPSMAPLDREIRIQEFEQDALRDRINKISTRITLKKTARADTTLPVSPLIALPDEAIRDAFIFTCHDAQVANHAPILLSHVSRRWYTIALNCAALWSEIRVRGPHSAKLLELFLERSRHFTLKGFLDLVPECSSDLAMLAVKILIPSMARFTQLHLDCPDNGVVRRFFKALQHSELPALHTLEISSDDIEDSWEDDEDLSPVNLRHLSPSSLRIDTRSLTVLQPNIHAVHTLQIDGGSPYSLLPFSRLYEMLASARQLTCLSIGSGVLKDVSERLDGIISITRQCSGIHELPNLTHFRCADPRFTPIIDWFASGPRLEVLVLKDIPLAEIPSFYAEAESESRVSSPAMHTLVLINCPANSKPHGAVQFARDTENIKHLYMLHSASHKSAFEEMAYQLPEHVLWPNLLTFTCDLPKFCQDPRRLRSLEVWTEQRFGAPGVSVPLIKAFEDATQTVNKKLLDGIQSSGEVGEYRRIPWPPKDDGVFSFPSSEVDFEYHYTPKLPKAFPNLTAS